jgi:hypothetical protein
MGFGSFRKDDKLLNSEAKPLFRKREHGKDFAKVA